METIFYKDTKPVEPRLSTAWLIEFPNGQQRIAIWHKDATIEEVHAYCRARYTRFKLTCLDVGEFAIDRKVRTINAYLPDARMVDQDWKVQI